MDSSSQSVLPPRDSGATFPIRACSLGLQPLGACQQFVSFYAERTWHSKHDALLEWLLPSAFYAATLPPHITWQSKGYADMQGKACDTPQHLHEQNRSSLTLGSLSPILSR